MNSKTSLIIERALWCVWAISVIIPIFGFVSNHTDVLLKYLSLSMKLSIGCMFAIISVGALADISGKKLLGLFVAHFVWLIVLCNMYLMFGA